LGGEFVFDYLAAGKGTERVRWDGLLWSALLGGKLSFDQTLRLVDSLGDADHAMTNGQVFRAGVMALRDGDTPALWEKVKALVSWENCKLSADEKWAWLERMGNPPNSNLGIAVDASRLDRLANLIMDCH